MTFIKLCSIDSRNEQSPTCEVVYETKESSFQTSPTDSSRLAQLGEHGTDDEIFEEIYFVLCNLRSVRNASDWPKVKNSTVNTFPYFLPHLSYL